MALNKLEFLQGYTGGSKKFEMPSTRLALDFLSISSSFCSQLRWHANTLFQFVVAPADAMRIANPNDIALVNTSVYSSSFREMKDVYPFDMKEWVYGRGNYLSWIIILGCSFLFFVKGFFSELSKLKFKQSLTVENLSKVVIVRKPVQIRQKSNPYYKTIFEDCETVSLSSNNIGADHRLCATPKIFVKACRH